MKLFILGLLAMLGTTQISKADFQPTTVNVGLDKAFAPIGFDDNDRVQIAVEGSFANTCYRMGPHAVRVDDANHTITIQQQAYLYGGICLQMIVPFETFIDVGLLKEGTYTIVDNQTKKELGKLPVLRSSNAGPDDFLYAPVTDAYIVNDHMNKKNSIVLSGTFSDRCSEIQEVRVLYQESVLVVQPIMKRTETACEPKKTRFVKVVELDKDVHGMYLLHVRSLNGQAINRMVDLQ